MSNARPVNQQPRFVLLVVALGALLAAMAGSMANLALPAIGRDMGISIESARWVVQAFLLATGVSMFLVGRISDLAGHTRVYLTGFVLFGLASAACGLSSSFTPLVIYRSIQGVGAAMLAACGPALLTLSVAPEKRGRALGLLASATYLGITLGPGLGGLLVSHLGWQWTFLINIPISLFVIILGWFFLPRRVLNVEKGFDYLGSLVLVSGLPLFLVGLSLVAQWGFGDWKTLVLLVSGLLLLLVFVRRQANSRYPVIDLNLFRNSVFLGASLSAIANYIALFGAIILMPFYLEEGLHLSTDEVGYLLAIQPLFMALVSSPAGSLSDRLGARGLACCGMLVLFLGLLAAAGLDSGSSLVFVGFCLAVMGLGTGIFITPNSSALMGAAPRSKQGSAGSVLAQARVLGMYVGIALTSSLYQLSGGQTGNPWRQQDFDSFQTALFVMACFALLGAIPIWLSRATKEKAKDKSLAYKRS